MLIRRWKTPALCGALVLAVAASLYAPSAGATPQTVHGTFDMLSYNVAGLPEGLSSSHPAVNMTQIAPLLDAYDLVLTQEDFANPDPPLANIRVYHDVLVAGSNFPYVSEPQLPPMGTNPDHPDALLGDGLNFFSKFPLAAVERTTWNDCMGLADHASDCLATKGFARSMIELAPGVTVDVYDLHADAGGAAEDQAARASNFAQLADYIKTHSAGHAVIIGGDTNLHTERPEAAETWRTFLEATGLDDVCNVIACGDDADVIDKIAFRSADGIELTPTSHVFERERFTDADGAPLSDHDPLHVNFDYTAEADPTVPPMSTAPSPSTTTSSATTSTPATTRPSSPTVTAPSSKPLPTVPGRPASPASAVSGRPTYAG